MTTGQGLIEVWSDNSNNKAHNYIVHVIWCTIPHQVWKTTTTTSSTTTTTTKHTLAWSIKWQNKNNNKNNNNNKVHTNLKHGGQDSWVRMFECCDPLWAPQTHSNEKHCSSQQQHIRAVATKDKYKTSTWLTKLKYIGLNDQVEKIHSLTFKISLYCCKKEIREWKVHVSSAFYSSEFFIIFGQFLNYSNQLTRYLPWYSTWSVLHCELNGFLASYALSDKQQQQQQQADKQTLATSQLSTNNLLYYTGLLHFSVNGNIISGKVTIFKKQKNTSLWKLRPNTQKA